MEQQLKICNEIKSMFEEYYSELKTTKIIALTNNLKNKYLGCYDANKKTIRIALTYEDKIFEPSQFIFTLLHEFAHCIDFSNNLTIKLTKHYDAHGKHFYDVFRNIISLANKLNIYKITMNGSLERIDSISCTDDTKSIKIGYSKIYSKNHSNEQTNKLSNKLSNCVEKYDLIRVNIRNGKICRSYTINLSDANSEDKLKNIIKSKLNIIKEFSISIDTGVLQNGSNITIIKNK